MKSLAIWIMLVSCLAPQEALASCESLLNEFGALRRTVENQDAWIREREISNENIASIDSEIGGEAGNVNFGVYKVTMRDGSTKALKISIDFTSSKWPDLDGIIIQDFLARRGLAFPVYGLLSHDQILKARDRFSSVSPFFEKKWQEYSSDPSQLEYLNLTGVLMELGEGGWSTKSRYEEAPPPEWLKQVDPDEVIRRIDQIRKSFHELEIHHSDLDLYVFRDGRVVLLDLDWANLAERVDSNVTHQQAIEHLASEEMVLLGAIGVER